jgi:hypothetical protein
LASHLDESNIICHSMYTYIKNDVQVLVPNKFRFKQNPKRFCLWRDVIWPQINRTNDGCISWICHATTICCIVPMCMVTCISKWKSLQRQWYLLHLNAPLQFCPIFKRKTFIRMKESCASFVNQWCFPC